MKKGFCEKCNDLVEYEIKEREETIEIKGKEYKYKRLLGYCKKCGEEISSNEINDENLERIDKVYRNEENIITTEEINSILSKYKIGKKPLSKLLGWGEITLIRYLKGDVPSKVYSAQLYNILNNEDYMSRLIEENKELITEKAYNNVKNAIKGINEQTLICRTEKEIEIIADLQKETKLMKSININDNYIYKDKIREKIKDLEDNMILFTNDKEKFNRYKYARDILEKLLEEE